MAMTDHEVEVSHEDIHTVDESEKVEVEMAQGMGHGQRPSILDEQGRALKEHAKMIKKLADKHRNALTSTPMFKNAAKSVFDQVDIDKSGRVDEKELFVAVLLFYSKMSAFVKGLLPPKFDDIRVLMKNVASKDHPDELDEVEFETLLMLMFEHMMGRVLVQCFMAFFVTPILASFCADLYYKFYVAGTAFSWLWSRAIAVNLFASAVVSLVIPRVLVFYEQKSEQYNSADARFKKDL